MGYDEKVVELLDLPEWLRPIAIVTIGYAAEKPWSTPRMCSEPVVHTDRYETKRKVRFWT